MRMPRFRIRTLMIMVAVAAVLTGVGIDFRRRVGYRQSMLRRHHEASLPWYCELYADAGGLSDPSDEIVSPGPGLDIVLKAEAIDRRSEYHVRMKEKWTHAVRSPWLPVAPDPPPPE